MYTFNYVVCESTFRSSDDIHVLNPMNMSALSSRLCLSWLLSHTPSLWPPRGTVFNGGIHEEMSLCPAGNLPHLVLPTSQNGRVATTLAKMAALPPDIPGGRDSSVVRAPDS